MELEKLKELIASLLAEPRYFGPKYWGTLEILALTDEQGFYEFLNIIKRKLPCEECHMHLLFKLDQLEKEGKMDQFKVKLSPFEFVIELHNMANVLQGKRTYTQEERLEEIYNVINSFDDK